MSGPGRSGLGWSGWGGLRLSGRLGGSRCGCRRLVGLMWCTPGSCPRRPGPGVVHAGRSRLRRWAYRCGVRMRRPGVDGRPCLSRPRGGGVRCPRSCLGRSVRGSGWIRGCGRCAGSTSGRRAIVCLPGWRGGRVRWAVLLLIGHGFGGHLRSPGDRPSRCLLSRPWSPCRLLCRRRGRSQVRPRGDRGCGRVRFPTVAAGRTGAWVGAYP